MKDWQTRIVIETQPSTITASTAVDQLGQELSEDELLEVIRELDDAVGTYDFTRRIYNYARDILAAGGELPEEGD